VSWLNPAAFFGLLALAVPILVHLFGRRVARRQRFPTLRLLLDARPKPATRSRPSDVLLLVLRCAVILAAVLGLAQPRWSNGERARSARMPVRAILVDTSASMLRRAFDGTTALQRARAHGQQMLDSAREAIVVETDQPGMDVPGAASWLEGRSGLRELVIISDFQAGAFSDGSLATVSESIGIRPVRIALSVPDSGLDSRRTSGGRPDVVQVDPQPTRTDATWAVPPPDTGFAVTVLAADADASLVLASMAAVREIAPHSSGSRRNIAVVFPGFPGRGTLAGQVAALNSVWHGDVMIALRRDPLLAAVADSARLTPSCESRGTPILHNGNGEAVATIGRSQPGSEHQILIFTCLEPGTVAGTSLLAAVVSAAEPDVPMQEREPGILPDETLRKWERPPASVGPRTVEETSPDGRWLWLAAIALLLLEEWVRRRAPRRQAPVLKEESRERVA